jgi:hypothetical protein
MKEKTAMQELYEDLEKMKSITDTISITDVQRKIGFFIEKERDIMEKMYNHAVLCVLDGNGHGQTFEEYYNEKFEQ